MSTLTLCFWIITPKHPDICLYCINKIKWIHHVRSIKYGGIYNIKDELLKVCIYHKLTILLSNTSKILYGFNPMIDELFLTL